MYTATVGENVPPFQYRQPIPPVINIAVFQNRKIGAPLSLQVLTQRFKYFPVA